MEFGASDIDVIGTHYSNEDLQLKDRLVAEWGTFKDSMREWQQCFYPSAKMFENVLTFCNKIWKINCFYQRLTRKQVIQCFNRLFRH